MGNIATLQPRSAPSGTVRGGNPGAGVDVGGLMRGVDNVANEQAREEHARNRMAAAAAERMQQDEAQIAVLKITTEAQAQFTERLNAAKEESVDGAAGFTAGILKEFEGWQENASKQVPTLGRHLFEQQAIRLKGALHGQAFTYEQTARHKKLASDFDTSLDAARRTVWADPSQFTQLAASHIATARNIGASEELRNKMASVARDTLAYDAAAGMTERNPNEVLQKLGFTPGKWQPGMPLPDTAKTADAVKNDPIFSNLPPEKLQGILHRALSLSASQDATTQRLTDKAEKDAADAVEALGKFTLTGAMASPDYVAQVQGLTKGSRVEQQANALLAASVQGAAIGGLLY